MKEINVNATTVVVESVLLKTNMTKMIYNNINDFRSKVYPSLEKGKKKQKKRKGQKNQKKEKELKVTREGNIS